MAGSSPAMLSILEGTPSMSDFILAIDQGTTSTRSIVFDGEQRIRGSAQRGVSAALSGVRLGRARAGGSVAHDARDRPWRARESRRRGAQDIAAIGITNQRETTLVWDRRTRQADPSRHRLAGPPHGGYLRAAPGGRRGAAVHAEDRAAARPLFLRHQDRLDARQRRRRARRGRGRAISPSARSTHISFGG